MPVQVSQPEELEADSPVEPAVEATVVEDDAVLMAAFKKGDARAFEGLLKRHRKGVYQFCFRMLNDRAQAEDALQEVFLRVVKNAKTWERNARVTTWLYTIARNYCIDALRRGAHRKTESLDRPLSREADDGPTLGENVPHPGPEPDRAAESERLRMRLEAALQSLSIEQREVFLMREYAGVPFKEIAEVLSISENTVKSRMRYALEHLRRHLRAQGIEESEP